MGSIFFTLQDFMVYTEGVTYLLMGLALILYTAYFVFLMDRDDD